MIASEIYDQLYAVYALTCYCDQYFDVSGGSPVGVKKKVSE
jgi:hypothetical protein